MMIGAAPECPPCHARCLATLPALPSHVQSLHLAGRRRVLLDTSFNATWWLQPESLDTADQAQPWWALDVSTTLSYSRTLELTQRIASRLGAKTVVWIHGDAELIQPELLALLVIALCRHDARDPEMHPASFGVHGLGLFQTYTDKLAAFTARGRNVSGPADPYISLYASDHDQYLRIADDGACVHSFSSMPDAYKNLWPPEARAIRHVKGSTVRATSRFTVEERWGERLDSCAGSPVYYQAKWGLAVWGQFKDSTFPNMCSKLSGKQPFNLQPAGGDFSDHARLMDGALPLAESLEDLPARSFPRFAGWLVGALLGGPDKWGARVKAFRRVASVEDAASLLGAVKSKLEAIAGRLEGSSGPALPLSQLQAQGKSIKDSSSLGQLRDTDARGQPQSACLGAGSRDGIEPAAGSGPRVDPCVMSRRGDLEALVEEQAATFKSASLPAWAWEHLVFVTHRGSSEATALTADSLAGSGGRRVIIDASAGASLFGMQRIARSLAGVGSERARLEALPNGATLVDPLTLLSPPMAMEMSRRIALRAGARFLVIARAGAVLTSASSSSPSLVSRASAMAEVLQAVAAAGAAGHGGSWGAVDLSCLVLVRRAGRPAGRACHAGQPGPAEALGVPPVLFAVSADAARGTGIVDPYTHSMTAAVSDWTARICRTGLPVVRALVRSDGRIAVGPAMKCGADAPPSSEAGQAWAEDVRSGATYWPAAVTPDEPRVEEAFGERLITGIGSQVYLRLKWGRWGDRTMEAPWRSVIESPFAGLGSSWLTNPPKPPNHQPYMHTFLGVNSQADVLAVGRMAQVNASALDRLAAAPINSIEECRRGVREAVEAWVA